MDFATFTTAALAALALYTGQNFIRYLKAADLNGILGIALSWLLGLGIAEWMAHASVTASMVLIKDAPAIGQLDFGSLCLLAVGLGSVAPVVADHIKAKDNNQSAAKPRLVNRK